MTSARPGWTRAGGVIMTEIRKLHHWSAYVHKQQMNNGHDFPMNAGEGFLLAGSTAASAGPALRSGHGYRATALPGTRSTSIETQFPSRFPCPFDRGDALAAGDLDGDGQDEVMVGSMARPDRDRLRSAHTAAMPGLRGAARALGCDRLRAHQGEPRSRSCWPALPAAARPHL